MIANVKGTALVTGASTGIGAVYADRLARRGLDLVLVARDETRMQVLAETLRTETGRTIEVLPADLTRSEDLARIERRLSEDSQITMLVNNAGMALAGDFLDNGPAELDRLLALNVVAPTRLAAAAGKAFALRAEGTIVNISSVLALAPELSEAAYSGTKAFLLNLSLKLGQDLAGTGVRVQAVLPGATRTEIWERSGKDVDALLPGRVMEAGDLVDAALLGLDRGETVTIPTLADERLWTAHTETRLALAPELTRRELPERYRLPLAA